MPYTTVTEAQIVANLINSYMTMVTTTDDIQPGSGIRSVFEAFAMELKKLNQSIGVSAAETQKMAAYTMFNFPLLPAQPAYTMVQFSTSSAPTSDTTVPAGTTVAVPGTSVQYKTPTDMTWPAGSASVSLRVVCTQPGTIGNQRAGIITQLSTAIVGLADVTVNNLKGVTNGQDQETEDQRANRFQQWVNSLHRGDQRALLYGAKQAQVIDSYGFVSEQVAKAQLVEGSGFNTLYIDNGTYDTSASLIAQCQQVIDGYTDENGVDHIGYKAAGIPTNVHAATVQSIAVSMKATPRPGYSFSMIQQSIIDNVIQYVQSLDVGDDLTLSALSLAIGNTPGVLTFQIVTPNADVQPQAGQILQLLQNQMTVVAM